MTNRALLKWAEARLTESGVDDAENDATELLQFVSGLDRMHLLFSKEEETEPETEEGYRALVEKRASRIPLQHLTGTAWFYGYPFSVNSHVLVPRFDTEILVHEALSAAGKHGYERVLDMCTGSGCIATVLSLEGKFTSVEACDISPEALAVAEKNAKENGASVHFTESDLFASVDGTFDMIVSNPPYIERAEIMTLTPEVREHDPMLALDGGVDGLDFYRRITCDAVSRLTPGGALLFEIGSGQAAAVSAIMQAAGYTEIMVVKDLAGLDRVVRGLRGE